MKIVFITAVDAEKYCSTGGQAEAVYLLTPMKPGSWQAEINRSNDVISEIWIYLRT